MSNNEKQSKKISIGGLRLSAPVVLIVGILLLFIPAYVAAALWAGGESTSLVTKNVSEALITFPSGGEARATPGGENEDLLSLFLAANAGAKTLPSLPDPDESGAAAFTVRYNVYGRDSTYTYYLTENPAACTFSSPDGGAYQIDDAAAAALLNHPRAEVVYAGATPPTLTAMGQTITPQEVSWNYKTYGGDYRASSSAFENTFFVNDMGELSLSFSCNFSRAPDALTVTLADPDGNQIYEGTLAGMTEVDLDGSADVTMTLTAEWLKNEGVACYGRAVYALKGLMHAMPAFYLNRGEVTEGGMVVLSGENVLDPAACTVSVAPSEPDTYAAYPYTPAFYRDGERVRALIPVSRDLQNGTCTYNVTVTLEETVYTMSFTATAAGEASPPSKNIGNEIYVPADTEVIDDPYAGLYSSLAETIAGATDFTAVDMAGVFEEGCRDYDGLRGVYGSYLNYTSIGKTILSHDEVYAGGKNTSLHAMHRGKVVYVGSTPYTGGIVVLDHGLGLLSWYWNLTAAESNIVVGATLETGDKIGNIGGSSFSEVYNSTYLSAHTALTVFGSPVNRRTIEGGVDFADDSDTRVPAQMSASAGSSSAGSGSEGSDLAASSSAASGE